MIFGLPDVLKRQGLSLPTAFCRLDWSLRLNVFVHVGSSIAGWYFDKNAHEASKSPFFFGTARRISGLEAFNSI